MTVRFPKVKLPSPAQVAHSVTDAVKDAANEVARQVPDLFDGALPLMPKPKHGLRRKKAGHSR